MLSVFCKTGGGKKEQRTDAEICQGRGKHRVECKFLQSLI